MTRGFDRAPENTDEWHLQPEGTGGRVNRRDDGSVAKALTLLTTAATDLVAPILDPL